MPDNVVTIDWEVWTVAHYTFPEPKRLHPCGSITAGGQRSGKEEMKRSPPATLTVTTDGSRSIARMSGRSARARSDDRRQGCGGLRGPGEGRQAG